MGVETRRQSRVRRHARVREKIKGSAARPRLAVFRSLTHIYAQLVDDDAGRTLAAASSKEAKDATGIKKRIDSAKTVGTLLGDRAKQKGVTEVVFDRGGYRYHGRVKALADGVREAGVKL
jgi:large subunit ribosomal protein L18